MTSTYTVPEPRAWQPFPLPSMLPTDPPPPNLYNAPNHRAAFDFVHGYVRTTHIFPAAWPRNAPFVPTPPTYMQAPDGDDKEGKKGWAKKIAVELLSLGKQYEDGKLYATARNNKVLWICANRYARASSVEGGSGTTLLCLHGNGMHKVLSSIPITT